MASPCKSYAMRTTTRRLVLGDLRVDAGDHIRQDLVVTGSLVLRRRSRVTGDVVVGERLVLEAGAAIEGDVRVQGEVVTGPGCVVVGDLERDADLHAAVDDLGLDVPALRT